ncbi:MAG: FAD binding domain-containing protein [Kiritimatiellae bacterium]|nr:FAD binding domain-containing protein [Kiritimatiellia bacterium]
MKLQEFVRPQSVEAAREALKALGRGGMALAGGTALHFMQNQTPVTAVDITRLGLSYIREEEGGYRIGATTPIADIQRYRAPRWALHEICRRMATHQIRNISTIGGNISRVFPWADLPVVLLAMGAEMSIAGDAGETAVGADEYFAEQPAKRFLGGDLLVSVKVPALAAHHGFGSVKVVRTSAAFSMVTVAAWLGLEGNVIREARVAAGAALPFPRRLPEVEAALKDKEACGRVFLEAAKAGAGAARWRGREGMSEEYSRHLASVTIHDALERAAQFAKERTA